MRLTLTTAVAAAAMAVAGAAGAQERVVNIYNWSDYIDPEVLDHFTEETGIAVVYDNYDNNEIVESKLLTGGSNYDVVVPSAPNVARLIQAGVLTPLDKAKIPNITHQWEEIANRLAIYDPDNAHATNYMWGTTGIGYNADKIAERMPDAPVDSWSMIFDPAIVSKFADCGVQVLNTPEEMIPAALNYLGLNPDSKDPAEIEKAGELLLTVKPHIRRFHSSDYIENLANGDTCLAVGYSGDIFQAKFRAEEAGNGVTVEYVIPKEGALMWFDSFIIPNDAPHPEEAYAFIDYMLRPEAAAANSNYVYYANGNKDSQPLLEEDVIGDPQIYPPADVMEKLYTVTPYDQRTQRVVTSVWRNVVGS